jgi:hypothetical protein
MPEVQLASPNEHGLPVQRLEVELVQSKRHSHSVCLHMLPWPVVGPQHPQARPGRPPEHSANYMHNYGSARK